MKRIFLLLAAALSVAEISSAATRPHYGGTLRVEMRGSFSTFDIGADANGNRVLLRDILLRSVCDRLITLDVSGNPRPSLATSWRSEREGSSWYLTLHEGIAMHNGITLTPQIVGTVLSMQNPNW